MKYWELVYEALQLRVGYCPAIPPIEVCENRGISETPSGGAPPEYVVTQIAVSPPCSEPRQHE
jgi:hypothetical protein